MRWIAGIVWVVVFFVSWCVVLDVAWVGMDHTGITDERALGLETGVRCGAMWVIAALVMAFGGAAFRALPGTRGTEGKARGIGPARVAIVIAWLVVAGLTFKAFTEVAKAQAAGTTTLTPEQQKVMTRAGKNMGPPKADRAVRPKAGRPARPKAKRSNKAKPVPELPGHYSYTDAKGTKHIVKGFDKVPPEYR